MQPTIECLLLGTATACTSLFGFAYKLSVGLAAGIALSAFATLAIGTAGTVDTAAVFWKTGSANAIGTLAR